MTTFGEKEQAYRDRQYAAYKRELDKAQTMSDKKEELVTKFSDMFASVMEEKVSEISDFPYDPDEFVKDVRDMILYMWEDYCG